LEPFCEHSTGITLSINSAHAHTSDFHELVQRENLVALQSYLDTLSSSEQIQILDSKNHCGDTALITAARQNNLELFDFLIQRGSDPNARDAKKRDILNIAIRERNPALAKQAIDAGTDPKAFTLRFQGSTLIFASHQGEVEIVNMLIQAGAPLDRRNNLGWTALLEATVLGDGGSAHQQVVTALLEAGADQTIADKNGLTPLDHARQKGHSQMVKVLKQF